jgi:DNA-binding SARP family transcriptional activator
VLVRLLGPIDVVDDDGVVRPVSGLRRKTVLAVLGLAAGEVVSTDQLLDALWEGQSSAIRLNTLQAHVSYLRRVLGGADTIVARGTGYRLDLGVEATDVQAAARLVERGRQERDPRQRADRLRAALELWRDRPLTDLAGLAWFDAHAERLAALRLEVILALNEARLALGEHVEVVPKLAELVREHPYREDVCRQLMLALYRAGRQAEALTAYHDLRGRLADELGIDPGPALRDLETAILRQDSALGPPTGTAAEERPAGTTHPLPADTGAFTGRAQESEEILAHAIAAMQQGRVMSVHAIDGMPGVGKTALAVHVAQRLAGQFAGRPVFVDLHGHTAGRVPADPAEVLAGLLAEAGVDQRYLPDGIEARSALWRRRTAERPVLLVLDNAASSSQVAPLLPASPGSVVLVTSRRFLGDLPVDVVPVGLGVLRPDEAAQMFLRLALRAAIDPDRVDEVVALCGYLPLAIALLARVLVRHRTWSVQDLLAETRARLITVTAEDSTVEAAFNLSYSNLATHRQRFFRYLGLHPGVEIDEFAAAALAGVPSAEAGRHLDALHADNLLVEAGYRRYTMHDLIRQYARGIAGADPATEGATALERLVDFYRYTATVADARVTRHTRPTVDLGPAPATGTPDLVDPDQALAWLRTERPNLLLACVAATGDPRRAVALTAAMSELLRRYGPWSEAIAVHRAAAEAAERAGDRLGRANALTELAAVLRLSSACRPADVAGRQALDLYRDLGDRLGEANALVCLGNIWRVDGDYPAAEEALRGALDLYRDVGDRLGQANALMYLGTVWYMIDKFPDAVRSLRHALDLYRDLGDWVGVAYALTYLGEVLRASGDYPAAVEALDEALHRHTELEDRLGQANALFYLGQVQAQAGDHQAGTQALKEVLDLYRDLGDKLGQANTMDLLAELCLTSGDHPGAMRAAREALDIYRDIDHRHGQATILMRIGRIRLATGNLHEAGGSLQDGIDLYRQLGDRSGEAVALCELAAVHRHAGRLAAARQRLTQAIELARQIDIPWDEAYALAGIGRCDLAAGDIAAAVAHLRESLAIFRRIGAAEADEVAADLEAAEARAALDP